MRKGEIGGGRNTHRISPKHVNLVGKSEERLSKKWTNYEGGGEWIQLAQLHAL